MIFTRDDYIGLLEKTAETEEPNYKLDNRAIGLAEHKSNMGDSREYLLDIFGQGKNTENYNGKVIKSVLSSRGERDTHNPLVKLALEKAFRRMALWD